MCKFLTRLFKRKKEEVYDVVDHIQITKFGFSNIELQVIDEINDFRLRGGLQRLQINFSLSSVALSHSLYMEMNSDVSHSLFPDRMKLIKHSLKKEYVGECVGFGFGTASGFVSGWIESEEHRKIIESPKAKEIGIAIIRKDFRNYATLILTD